MKCNKKFVMTEKARIIAIKIEDPEIPQECYSYDS